LCSRILDYDKSRYQVESGKEGFAQTSSRLTSTGLAENTAQLANAPESPASKSSDV
jgi:hypothetical protein